MSRATLSPDVLSAADRLFADASRLRTLFSGQSIGENQQTEVRSRISSLESGARELRKLSRKLVAL